ncbi:MAG: hypothetical protein NXH82_00035 [Rhodobacteraceae bacterium]|nr:hypothetical protein [Paracoccaceae bacterium]
MKSKMILPAAAALMLAGIAPAHAGQIAVISPPSITVTPSVSSPSAAAPAPTVNPAVSPSGRPVSVGVAMTSIQSVNLGALTPGQLQLASQTIQTILSNPGRLSPAQQSVLQAQLSQISALLGR